MRCGVYEIVHVESGRRYIGSAKHLGRRFSEHRKHLRRGQHHSRYLQAAWNKYGEAAFVFRLLLVCGEDMRREYEQRLLDGLNPEFNAAKNVLPGVPIGEETRKVMSKAQRGWRKKYDWQGESLCISDIAARVGMDVPLLISRVVGQGMTPQQAVGMGDSKGFRLMHEHDGRTLSRTEWAKELGMHPRRLQYWLSSGLTIGDCIYRLHRTSKAMSLRQFCAIWGISDTTVKSRLQKGDSIADAMRNPVKTGKAVL
jgi:hypothetical protein